MVALGETQQLVLRCRRNDADLHVQTVPYWTVIRASSTVYIYKYVCVCVCVRMHCELFASLIHRQPHVMYSQLTGDM